MTELELELAVLLKKHSEENKSNTPDYVLATYLSACLDAFNEAVRERARAQSWLSCSTNVERSDKH